MCATAQRGRRSHVRCEWRQIVRRAAWAHQRPAVPSELLPVWRARSGLGGAGGGGGGGGRSGSAGGRASCPAGFGEGRAHRVDLGRADLLRAGRRRRHTWRSRAARVLVHEGPGSVARVLIPLFVSSAAIEWLSAGPSGAAVLCGFHFAGGLNFAGILLVFYPNFCQAGDHTIVICGRGPLSWPPTPSSRSGLPSFRT